MLAIFAVIIGGIVTGRLLVGWRLAFVQRLITFIIWALLFPYFLLGFLIVAYSGLSLIGVTMFAAILAFILDKVLYGKGANA